MMKANFEKHRFFSKLKRSKDELKEPYISEKAGDLDHSSPELIDHLSPVVYICYHVDYIFEHQTGQRWSRALAFPIFFITSYRLNAAGVWLGGKSLPKECSRPYGWVIGKL